MRKRQPHYGAVGDYLRQREHWNKSLEAGKGSPKPGDRKPE